MLATRRGSKLGGEISFHDVALDCEAFERVKPQISRTGQSPRISKPSRVGWLIFAIRAATVNVIVPTVEVEEDALRGHDQTGPDDGRRMRAQA